MTSILSPIPRFIFMVFEPLSLVAGFVGATVDPQWFVAEQVALSSVEALSPNATAIALQLGNMFLLASFVGIGVLYTTTEPKVVRNYLIALWLADISHVAITYYTLEFDRFIDVRNWNAMAWGNIATTVFLFLSRTAYFLGLFGPGRSSVDIRRNEKHL